MDTELLIRRVTNLDRVLRDAASAGRDAAAVLNRLGEFTSATYGADGEYVGRPLFCDHTRGSWHQIAHHWRNRVEKDWCRAGAVKPRDMAKAIRRDLDPLFRWARARREACV
ncbi:hypothetical protein [Gemmata sp.]|uniref:hypothetical protein n=1 Tax=Gemmata sp. TaxID=1914242 RepID=UPI003F706C41